MTPAEWERCKRILADAITLPSGERSAYVDRECADPTLAREVKLLLDEYNSQAPSLEPVNLERLSALPAESIDRDLELGSQVGPYQVIDVIGRGGMGQVYLGRDKRLHRKVALKSVLHAGAADEDDRTRVIREARAAAQISHPNVATIHDIVDHPSGAFIVMEFVDGESLAAVMRRGRLPLDRVFAIGRQLCAAVAAAHAQGVIHRDLKPGNIQVTADGTVKVLDFGIAGVTRPLGTTVRAPTGTATHAGQPGTPGYMPPEQLLSQHFDERSDLFSLGIVLFELATGERAYSDVSESGYRAAVSVPVRRADSVAPGVPRALADLIARALEIDPAKRFASATEMAQALERAEGRHVAPVRSWRRAAISVVIGVPAVLALCWMIGRLSTAVFNLALDRTPPWDADSAGALFDIGRRALGIQVFYGLVWLLLISAIGFAFRVLRHIGPVGRLFAKADARLSALAALLRLHEPWPFVQAFAAVSVVVILVMVWFCAPYLVACFQPLDVASADVIRQIEAGRPTLLMYRRVLEVVILGSVASLVYLRRITAHHHTTSHVAPGWIVAAVMALALTLSAFPYRLLWSSTTVAMVQGERCYVLGRSAEKGLVFCPDRPTARRQVVDLSAAGVVLLDKPQFMFRTE